MWMQMLSLWQNDNENPEKLFIFLEEYKGKKKKIQQFTDERSACLQILIYRQTDGQTDRQAGMQ